MDSQRLSLTPGLVGDASITPGFAEAWRGREAVSSSLGKLRQILGMAGDIAHLPFGIGLANN